MTLSAEYSCDEKGDRGGGGGALAHQRRLIRGLFLWAALLTLGLAASLTLHFIHKESPAPHHGAQDSGNVSELKSPQPSTLNILTTYAPAWDKRNKISVLQWSPSDPFLIEGKEKLRVKEHGEYFLYLQVTLVSPRKEDHIIDVRTENDRLLLRGYFNGSNISTGFIGVALFMNTGETFNVTCTPSAEIHNSDTETYMGVIRLG